MPDAMDTPSWTEFKRTVFDSLMALTGRVFVVVHHSPDVLIGRRGFLPEERERGLVLVLNSSMPMEWDGDSLKVRLVFGSTPEDCRIPLDRIVAMYNPDSQVQFLAPPRVSEEEGTKESGLPTGKTPVDETEEPAVRDASSGKDDKVVRIDFGRNRRED